MTGREAVDRVQIFQLSSCEYNLRGHSTKLSKRTSVGIYNFIHQLWYTEKRKQEKCENKQTIQVI